MSPFSLWRQVLHWPFLFDWNELLTLLFLSISSSYLHTSYKNINSIPRGQKPVQSQQNDVRTKFKERFSNVIFLTLNMFLFTGFYILPRGNIPGSYDVRINMKYIKLFILTSFDHGVPTGIISSNISHISFHFKIMLY